MNPWILAARPRTLGAAIVPVVTGCALAFAALLLIVLVVVFTGGNDSADKSTNATV
jgi:1,4-dihydroxy-2-naphthoate octaprenyltransferase